MAHFLTLTPLSHLRQPYSLEHTDSERYARTSSVTEYSPLYPYGIQPGPVAEFRHARAICRNSKHLVNSEARGLVPVVAGSIIQNSQRWAASHLSVDCDTMAESTTMFAAHTNGGRFTVGSRLTPENQGFAADAHAPGEFRSCGCQRTVRAVSRSQSASRLTATNVECDVLT